MSTQLTIFSRFSGRPLPDPFWGLNDLGGYWWPPPIPFGPPPLVTSIFHFQHSLLFLASFWFLNFRSRFGALMIQVDIGGHPPIPFGPPPLVLSVFQFQHNLIFLAFFRGMNFQSRFEALNDIFWETWEQDVSMNQFFSHHNL